MGQKEKEKEKETLMSKLKDKGLIAIKPLVQETPTSMGLEKYGLVIFPSAVHSEPMKRKIMGNRKIFENGLNENADSVLSIKDPETRKAKIKTIRETVAYLEKRVHFTELDTEDPDFWDKVQTFRPNNADYFGKIRLNYSNDDRYLFPDSDTSGVEDLVIY